MSTDRDPNSTTAFEPYAAGVLTEMGVEPYVSGGKWRFEVDEVQMMALVTRVHGDGAAAGRKQAADRLRLAAAGRRQYAVSSPDDAELLGTEAKVLDAAAQAAEGDDGPLYGWVPSWMWTEEMRDRIDAVEGGEPRG